MAITPELVDKWSELAKRLFSVDLPARDFFEAAIRLDELEKSEDKPFPTLAMEYVRLKEGVDELKSKAEETKKEGARLRKETEDLQRRKRRLSSEVGSREGLLRRANDIGLSEEELLQVTTFIDRTSKNEGTSGNQLKKRFFIRPLSRCI